MEKKKMSLGKKVLIGLGILAIIGMIGSAFDEKKGTANSQTQEVEAQPTDWKTMTYEEREGWIKSYLKKPDDNGYALVTLMKDELKKQFAYPKEVDFDWGEAPLLNRGRVVDADQGLVFFNGKGTSKNGFGVKFGFRYSIRTKIRPDSLVVDNVSVSEDK